MRPITSALAAVALLVAGGAGGAALSPQDERAPTRSHRGEPAPVDVRTQVVHRTVRVVRHVKRRHPASAAPPAPVAPPAPAPAPAPAAARAATQAVVVEARSPAPRAAPPLRTRSSATGAGNQAARPLQTRSSATGVAAERRAEPDVGERENEHENGDD